MNRGELLDQIHSGIAAGIVNSWDRVNSDRYIVYVCAMFDDGDHPVVLLVKRHRAWWFTDDGNTFAVRLGKGSIEMSLKLGYGKRDFAYDLRTFVDALLAVDAAMRKKAEAGT